MRCVYGVLIGAIIALLYRTNDMIIYANRKIMRHSPWKSYRLIVFYILLFVCVVVLNEFVSFNIANYGQFIIYGIVFTLLFLVVYFSIELLLNSKDIIYLKKKSFKQSKKG